MYLKLLAKEPHQRPATAQDILDVLCLDDQGVESSALENPSSSPPDPLQTSLKTDLSLIETLPSPYDTQSNPIHLKQPDMASSPSSLPPQQTLSFIYIVLLSILSVTLGIGVAYFI